MHLYLCTSIFLHSVSENTDESMPVMGHLLWYCYGQHSHTSVRQLKHAAHLYTHNWVKWNRVCLGVCYVTTSVVHCFLCPASFACLTAARVQCRWIIWRISVRYNVLWKHPKVMRNRYDSSIILVFVATVFRRLWRWLDKAFTEKALQLSLYRHYFIWIL